jgi:hypothetical protein
MLLSEPPAGCGATVFAPRGFNRVIREIVRDRKTRTYH